jgi:hypothetical protein
MTKKQIRIILACTVLLPVWALTAFAIFIFPGVITFFLAPIEAIRLLLKLWLKENIDYYEREEIIRDLKECPIMMFAPIFGAYFMAYNFVQEGELSMG